VQEGSNLVIPWAVSLLIQWNSIWWWWWFMHACMQCMQCMNEVRRQMICLA
jgi:hypothetical protein